MSTTSLLRAGVFLGLLAFLIYLLSPIVTPFLLGALVAYLGNPMVSYLAKKHIPRWLGAACIFLLVFVVLTGVILLVLPLMQEQMLLALQKIPLIVSWWQDTVLSWVNVHLHANQYFNSEKLKASFSANTQKFGQVTSMLIKTATHSTFAMISFISNVILVPVVGFYLMRDWPTILKNFEGILPQKVRAKTRAIAIEADAVLGAFFRGQLLVMISLSIIYATGLWWVGLQVAIFVGLISGLLAIVPYLGFTLGIVVASIAMYVETHAMMSVFYVWGVYAVGQMAESMLLTPLLVGDKIGLHPVAVIFAVLSGGLLFGFLGVLLALPVAAVLLVIIKHFLAQRIDAVSP